MLNISSLSYLELQELIKEIDELLPHKEENQWLEDVRRLEREAIEVVEELRKKTGRDYKLLLHGYPLSSK